MAGQPAFRGVHSELFGPEKIRIRNSLFEINLISEHILLKFGPCSTWFGHHSLFSQWFRIGVPPTPKFSLSIVAHLEAVLLWIEEVLWLASTKKLYFADCCIWRALISFTFVFLGKFHLKIKSIATHANFLFHDYFSFKFI